MRLRQNLIFGFVAALTGCDVVTSSHPVGHEIPSIDIREWEGTWGVDDESDSVLVVEIEDSVAATLKATMVPAETPISMVLRSAGNDLFLSLDIGPKMKGYYWFRVAMYGDAMLVWPPDASKLGRLVEAEILPGETADGQVALAKLSAENMELITSDEHGVLFHWKSPLMLRRVSP